MLYLLCHILYTLLCYTSLQTSANKFCWYYYLSIYPVVRGYVLRTALHSTLTQYTSKSPLLKHTIGSIQSLSCACVIRVLYITYARWKRSYSPESFASLSRKMAAARIATIYKCTRYACDKVGPRQCYRYMAAIPETMRMESKEKREYERKLVYWRRDMSELRKKFSLDYQRLMQSQLSSQEDNIEEERQRENVIEKMLQERNRESLERR